MQGFPYNIREVVTVDLTLSRIVDESIQLELNIAKLYISFHETFPEHGDFWWALHIEENNHAALIRSVKEHFVPSGQFPSDLLSSKLNELKETNSKIALLIKRYEHQPPTEAETFNVALELEESAGEIHFQKFMDKEEDSILYKIFQKLNRDDKNHALRLRSYMDTHDLSIRCRD